MNELETTRLSRLVMVLTLLQTKRVVTASELAHRFSVSTRTIYRDIRTLEAAGVPVVTLEGKGYSLMEGYRIPAVMFTREQAMALLIAEKLAASLTDPPTALRLQYPRKIFYPALRHWSNIGINRQKEMASKKF